MPLQESEAVQGNLLIYDNSQGKEKTVKQLDVAVVTAVLLLLML